MSRFLVLAVWLTLANAAKDSTSANPEPIETSGLKKAGPAMRCAEWWLDHELFGAELAREKAASANECQKECQDTKACRFFSYSEQRGCHLRSGMGKSYRIAAGAVAGPKSCTRIPVSEYMARGPANALGGLVYVPLGNQKDHSKRLRSVAKDPIGVPYDYPLKTYLTPGLESDYTWASVLTRKSRSNGKVRYTLLHYDTQAGHTTTVSLHGSEKADGGVLAVTEAAFPFAATSTARSKAGCSGGLSCFQFESLTDVLFQGKTQGLKKQLGPHHAETFVLRAQYVPPAGQGSAGPPLVTYIHVKPPADHKANNDTIERCITDLAAARERRICAGTNVSLSSEECLARDCCYDELPVSFFAPDCFYKTCGAQQSSCPDWVTSQGTGISPTLRCGSLGVNVTNADNSSRIRGYVNCRGAPGDGSIFRFRGAGTWTQIYPLEITEAAIVRIATGANNFDPILALLSDCCGEPEACIFANDDGPYNLNPKIERLLQPGSYFVALGGLTGDTGKAMLDVTCSPGGTN
ncbi:unnamed protein product [Vitrella brassicaformis CCMP3155]|uniref:Apple domain-containing protein n=1 Tax=Vitrella brassicaformis (strain CCMP3155) TaxID=1169540 RepID=A0A0G4FWK0_VITBC|nr:unnamed protein product [Vitrella brassicaformis CCMP3155]|eukprot:CEM19513.1 unnamed protein product [Vitrella brassicaformis CCMP3155]